MKIIKYIFISLLVALAFQVSAHPKRDPKAVRIFRYEHPCPATGKHHGTCSGYEIDHVIPLKCGGADKPDNMQWLTAKDHKAKTKRQAKLCLKKARQSGL
jgi:5-methylcytosine-specific restriction endonuclease McrA